MDKKYAFEIVVCGGVRTYFGLRKGRLLHGGSTLPEAIRALAGKYDRAESYWYGALEGAERALVLRLLGLNDETAVELIKMHKRRVRARRR